MQSSSKSTENRNQQQEEQTSLADIDRKRSEQDQRIAVQSDSNIERYHRRMPPYSTNTPTLNGALASHSNAIDFSRTLLLPMPQLPTAPSEDMLFPSKLFHMLNDACEKGFEDIVAWGYGPCSFNVYQKRIFENKILPKYFKMTQYKSFTRQLHNYEFRWIRGGIDKGGCMLRVFPFYCLLACLPAIRESNLCCPSLLAVLFTDCHKYFSRDGTHLDRLLSRKAIAGVQAQSVPSLAAARESSMLTSAGARHWSSPALFQDSQTTEETRYPRNDILPLSSPLSMNDCCVDNQHRWILMNKGDPLGISTHSGGYLLHEVEASFARKMSQSLSLPLCLQSQKQSRDKEQGHLSCPSADGAAFFGESLDFSSGRVVPIAASRRVDGPSHSMDDAMHLLSEWAIPHATSNFGHEDQQQHLSAHLFDFLSRHRDMISSPTSASATASATASAPTSMMLEREDLLISPPQSFPRISNGDTEDSKSSPDRMLSSETSIYPGILADECRIPPLEPRTIEQMLSDDQLR